MFEIVNTEKKTYAEYYLAACQSRIRVPLRGHIFLYIGERGILDLLRASPEKSRLKKSSNIFCFDEEKNDFFKQKNR